MATAGRMCSSLFRGVYAVRLSQIKDTNFLRNQWCLTSTAAETNGTKAETDTPAPEVSDTGPEATAADALAKAQQQFTEDKQKLTDDFAVIQDKYKRSLAETENVRRRMKKQVDDAKVFGVQRLCNDLIDVADILSAATDSVPKDQLGGTNPHLDSLYKGLTMTETQLQKVFTSHGLAQITPTEGEKFDPNIHEALFQAPKADGKEEGTVAVVTKIGYSLHSRTLRPALVGVYKGD